MSTARAPLLQFDAVPRAETTINVTDPLRTVARRQPDAPAIIAGQSEVGMPAGRVVTYAALDRIVDGVARRTAAWRVAPGDRVNLLLRQHFPLLALKLGCARAGVATCGIDVPAGATARVVLRDNGVPFAGRTFFVEESWWSDVDVPPAPMHPGGDALFMLQGTSGTNGFAKAVPVTHAMFLARARIAGAHPHPARVRLMCTSGPGGGYGLRHILRALDAGGTVVLGDSGSDIAALVDRHRVSMLIASPHAVSRLLEQHPAGAPRPPTLEQLSIGGSLLSGALVRAATERLCAHVLCTYGSTEAGAVAIGAGSAMRDIEGAAGFVLPEVDVEAVDAQGKPLPRGRSGALRIRAPGQASRYHGDDAASARAFRDGWFHPGDLGHVTEDGILVIAGRIDDLLNLGGSKFAPELVETVLMQVPGMRDAAAFGVPDAFGMQVLHAAIVTERDVDVATIEAAFRANPGIPPPTVVLRATHLPRNESGKLERHVLAEFARSLRACSPTPPVA